MDQELRSLSDFEREVVNILLIADFPGRDVIRKCIEISRVKTIDEHGSLKFYASECARAETSRNVPVEGRAIDIDGVPIYVLLHTPYGIPSEMEVYKADGSAILDLNVLKGMEVYSLPPESPR